MHRYKKELLGAIDKMVKEVRSSRSYYAAVSQDYAEEAFFSGSSGDEWESQQGEEGFRIADTMLRLLGELRERFDELT
jgi:hypothetical protein